MHVPELSFGLGASNRATGVPRVISDSEFGTAVQTDSWKLEKWKGTGMQARR